VENTLAGSFRNRLSASFVANQIYADEKARASQVTDKRITVDPIFYFLEKIFAYSPGVLYESFFIDDPETRVGSGGSQRVSTIA